MTAAGARLGRVLHRVADSVTPAADDWADVVARAGGTAMPTPLPGTGPDDRRTRVLAVAAAIVVLVAALGVGAALRAEDDDRSGVRSGPADPVDEPGWYVPDPLPAGWSVRDVTLATFEPSCPCRQTTWADPTSSRSLSYTSSAADPSLGDRGTGDREVDLGAGITGHVLDRPVTVISWSEDDRVRIVTSTGAGPIEVVAVARDLVGEPDPTASPVAGLTLRDDWVGEPGTTVHRVTVSLTTASGRTIGYELATPAAGRSVLLDRSRQERRVAGQPLPTLDGRPDGQAGFFAPSEVGFWPGADLSLPVVVDEDTPFGTGTGAGTGDATEAEVAQLLGSLRPAPPAAWRAFLAAAPEHDPALDDLTGLSSRPDR